MSKLMNIENLEIDSLNDQELDSVAGAWTDTTTAASCACCASGATNQVQR